MLSLIPKGYLTFELGEILLHPLRCATEDELHLPKEGFNGNVELASDFKQLVEGQLV